MGSLYELVIKMGQDMINRYELVTNGAIILSSVLGGSFGSSYLNYAQALLFFLNAFHWHTLGEINNQKFVYLMALMSVSCSIMFSVAASNNFFTVMSWINSAFFLYEVNLDMD